MMKIAVTGHLGTIGAPLVRALRAAGHEVIGIDQRHHSEGVRADVADYSQLAGAMPGDSELVYHLAAEFGRYNGEDFAEQLWRTNAVGTKNVLKLQRARGFKLIFASSSEVYGERPDEPVLHEGLPLSPFYLSNDYAISKLVNEGQIANAQKQWGAQAMTLRFFNAYGPGEHYHAYRSVVCLFCYRALKRLPYTVYDGYHRVFQHVDDLVTTLVAAAAHFQPGLVANVAGTEYRSVRELHEEICRLVDVDESLVTFAPVELHNVTSKRPSIEVAHVALGHDPRITLREGLKGTIEWMRKTYSVQQPPLPPPPEDVDGFLKRTL
jgi:dTDP-glucose 4,6-dehydratase